MEQTSNYQLNQWDKTDRIQMEDFNADNDKIDAALAGIAAANQYVKIKEMTTPSTSSQVNFDVSDVDFTEYHTVELFCSDANGSNIVLLRVNGKTTDYLDYSLLSGSANNTTDHMGALGGRMLFSSPKAGQWVNCLYFYNNYSSFTSQQASAPVNWEDVRTFNLYRKTSTIPAGTIISLYGLKK